MICAVIVTYANRYALLSKVINSCLTEGVDEIIVVDNRSVDESRSKLTILERQLKGKLQVIYSYKNLGSAGGFKLGLEEAYKKNCCEYIWLLDDDNLPEQGSLKYLLEKVLTTRNTTSTVYLCYRESRPVYFVSYNANYIDNILGSENDFLGIGVKSFGAKVIRKFTNFCKLKDSKIKNLGVAPYGGLFFHKEVIDRVGFPNDNYVLYYDDFDFTYRMFLNGIRIEMVVQSKIRDIDDSIWDTSEQSKFHYAFLDAESDLRIYYSVRNTVYFTKQYRVSNKVAYYLNAVVFFITLFFLSLLKIKPKRFMLILHAVKDGLTSNLQINKKYLLS